MPGETTQRIYYNTRCLLLCGPHDLGTVLTIFVTRSTMSHSFYVVNYNDQYNIMSQMSLLRLC